MQIAYCVLCSYDLPHSLVELVLAADARPCQPVPQPQPDEQAVDHQQQRQVRVEVLAKHWQHSHGAHVLQAGKQAHRRSACCTETQPAAGATGDNTIQ